MTSGSDSTRTPVSLNPTLTWFLLFCLLFSLELIGATLMGQPLPLPAWYVGLGFLLALFFSGALGLAWFFVRDVTDDSSKFIGPAAVIALVLLGIRIYVVGGLYYLAPYVASLPLVMIPYLNHLYSERSNRLFWLGLPLVFLSTGAFFFRILFDYRSGLSITHPSLLAMVFLLFAAGVGLTVLDRNFSRLIATVESHRSLFLGLVLGLVVLSFGVFFLKSVTPQWSLGTAFDGTLPDVRYEQPLENQARPNIILISLDTLRFDSLRTDMGQSRLPELTRDGITFKSVISTSGWTLPSHASLFTSRLPYHHGAVHYQSKMNRNATTYPQYLHKLGYQTAAFTDGGYVSKVFGFSRGFERYWEQTPSRYNEYVPGLLEIVSRALQSTRYHLNQKTTFSTIRKPPLNYARRTLGKAREWINDRNPDDPPYFLFLHTYQAHDYRNRFPDSMQRLKENHPELYRAVSNTDNRELKKIKPLTPTIVEAYRTLYGYEVRRTFQDIRQFLDGLKQNRQYKNSLIVFFSDHGEGFSLDQKILGHANGQLGEVLVRVPMILKLPGNRYAGQTIGEMISIRDVFPLLLDHLSIRVGPASTTPSYRKLERLLTTPDSGRSITSGSTIYSETKNTFDPKVFVRSDSSLLIHAVNTDASWFYRITSSTPYQKPHGGPVDPLLTDSMKRYIEEFKQHRDVYSRKTSALSEGTRRMLQGLGYLD